jgi:transposase-like protein
MLENMMSAERGEYLSGDRSGDKGNGYRLGHTYGQGRTLEFRIPRDRYGNFHPQILAIFKGQEEECEKLAGALYTKGLTQSQVGDVFDEIYGEHYSKASISRMLDYLRKDVGKWLCRSLDEYYPVLFIDCVFIKVQRRMSCGRIFPLNAIAAMYDTLEAQMNRVRHGDPLYKSYFTYLNYHPRIQSMIYTTNWIERLQKDFRRVTRMRGAMPNEESVLLLMGRRPWTKKPITGSCPASIVTRPFSRTDR